MLHFTANDPDNDSDMLSIESDDSAGRSLIASFRKQIADFVVNGPKKEIKDATAQTTMLTATEIGRVCQFLPDRRIAAIKETRAITGLGLKESKEFVDTICATPGFPSHSIQPQPYRDNVNGWDKREHENEMYR